MESTTIRGNIYLHPDSTDFHIRGHSCTHLDAMLVAANQIVSGEKKGCNALLVDSKIIIRGGTCLKSSIGRDKAGVPESKIAYVAF